MAIFKTQRLLSVIVLVMRVRVPPGRCIDFEFLYYTDNRICGVHNNLKLNVSTSFFQPRLRMNAYVTKIVNDSIRARAYINEAEFIDLY